MPVKVPSRSTAELAVLDLGPGVRQRDHVLAAGLGPGDRPPERPSRSCEHDVLVGDPGLRAEPAAHMRRDDPDLGLVDTERSGELTLEQMGHLRRAVEREAAVVPGHRSRAVRLDRYRCHTLVHVATADDDLGIVEHVADRVGGDDGDVVRAVLEEPGRILGERGLRVDDGREGIEIDEHRLGGIDGLAKRLGDHHRHGFADEPDAVTGQRPAGEGVTDLDEAVGGRQVEVGAGVDGDDPGRGRGLGHIDGDDAPVRHRRPYEEGMQGPVEGEVVDVGAAPGEQFGVFRASDAVAEDRSSHGRSVGAGRISRDRPRNCGAHRLYRSGAAPPPRTAPSRCPGARRCGDVGRSRCRARHVRSPAGGGDLLPGTRHGGVGGAGSPAATAGRRHGDHGDHDAGAPAGRDRTGEPGVRGRPVRSGGRPGPAPSPRPGAPRAAFGRRGLAGRCGGHRRVPRPVRRTPRPQLRERPQPVDRDGESSRAGRLRRDRATGHDLRRLVHRALVAHGAAPPAGDHGRLCADRSSPAVAWSWTASTGRWVRRPPARQHRGRLRSRPGRCRSPSTGLRSAGASAPSSSTCAPRSSRARVSWSPDRTGRASPRSTPPSPASCRRRASSPRDRRRWDGPTARHGSASVPRPRSSASGSSTTSDGERLRAQTWSSSPRRRRPRRARARHHRHALGRRAPTSRHRGQRWCANPRWSCRTSRRRCSTPTVAATSSSFLARLRADGAAVLHSTHLADEFDVFPRRLHVERPGTAHRGAPPVPRRAPRASRREPRLMTYGVGHVYGVGTPWERRVLAGVDLTVAPGEVLVVAGPNGSGKSTWRVSSPGSSDPAKARWSSPARPWRARTGGSGSPSSTPGCSSCARRSAPRSGRPPARR